MTKNIRIIGVPVDLGQTHRGVDMGPAALRYADLASHLEKMGFGIQDNGNIPVPIRESLVDEQGVNYLPSIQKVCEAIYEAGRLAVVDNSIPFFMGGDHSLSIGSIGGVTHHEPIGVIWIDAHGDFNTDKTSTSGNIHGMALAALIGKGFPELVNVGRPGPKILASDVVMIGVRDLDPGEKVILRESGITVYTMRDIDERGMHSVAVEALDKLKHRRRLHVSLDMDGLDPTDVPGVGTPSPGGLTYREAHFLMEIIADTKRVASMDIVEINPILDHRNKSAELAVELAASLLGRSIL